MQQSAAVMSVRQSALGGDVDLGNLGNLGSSQMGRILCMSNHKSVSCWRLSAEWPCRRHLQCTNHAARSPEARPPQRWHSARVCCRGGLCNFYSRVHLKQNDLPPLYFKLLLRHSALRYSPAQAFSLRAIRTYLTFPGMLMQVMLLVI